MTMATFLADDIMVAMIPLVGFLRLSMLDQLLAGIWIGNQDHSLYLVSTMTARLRRAAVFSMMTSVV